MQNRSFLHKVPSTLSAIRLSRASVTRTCSVLPARNHPPSILALPSVQTSIAPCPGAYSPIAAPNIVGYCFSTCLSRQFVDTLNPGAVSPKIGMGVSAAAAEWWLQSAGSVVQTYLLLLYIVALQGHRLKRNRKWAALPRYDSVTKIITQPYI
jgi:hypothetical protein